jgi:hypothetical protein
VLEYINFENHRKDPNVEENYIQEIKGDMLRKVNAVQARPTNNAFVRNFAPPDYAASATKLDEHVTLTKEKIVDFMFNELDTNICNIWKKNSCSTIELKAYKANIILVFCSMLDNCYIP